MKQREAVHMQELKTREELRSSVIAEMRANPSAGKAHIMAPHLVKPGGKGGKKGGKKKKTEEDPRPIIIRQQDMPHGNRGVRFGPVRGPGALESVQPRARGVSTVSEGKPTRGILPVRFPARAASPETQLPPPIVEYRSSGTIPKPAPPLRKVLIAGGAKGRTVFRHNVTRRIPRQNPANGANHSE